MGRPARAGMAEVEIESGLTENTVGLVERFIEVATTDPIATVLVLAGVVFVAVAMGVFGVLTLGGVLSWVSAAIPGGGAPAREAR